MKTYYVIRKNDDTDKYLSSYSIFDTDPVRGEMVPLLQFTDKPPSLDFKSSTSVYRFTDLSSARRFVELVEAFGQYKNVAVGYYGLQEMEVRSEFKTLAIIKITEGLNDHNKLFIRHELVDHMKEEEKEEKLTETTKSKDLPDKFETFETGAVRNNDKGRGHHELICPFALDRLAKLLEKGANCMAPRNWEKGMPVSRFIRSTLRHLLKYMMGKRDEDHLAAAMFNVMCAMRMECDVEAGDLDEKFLDVRDKGGPFSYKQNEKRQNEP